MGIDKDKGNNKYYSEDKSAEEPELPCPYPEQQFLVKSYNDFYNYLRRTKFIKNLEIFMFKLVTEGITDEDNAIKVLRQSFGGIPQQNEDTTKITDANERSVERVKFLKEELKIWTLQFLDAVERSTNHELFVDEDLRTHPGSNKFSRAATLLQQFACFTTVSDIMKTRAARGIETPEDTAAVRCARQRKELEACVMGIAKDLKHLEALETECLCPTSAFVREYNVKGLEGGEEILVQEEEEPCVDDNISEGA